MAVKKAEKKQAEKTRLADNPLAERLKGLETRIIDLEGAFKAHMTAREKVTND